MGGPEDKGAAGLTAESRGLDDAGVEGLGGVEGAAVVEATGGVTGIGIGVNSTGDEEQAKDDTEGPVVDDDAVVAPAVGAGSLGSTLNCWMSASKSQMGLTNLMCNSTGKVRLECR